MEQIENIKAREVKSEVVEKEKGLALPIPGTKAASELASKSSQIDDDAKKVDELSFSDELEKGPVQNSEGNTIIAAIVAGIVIAGIIGGVIFKLRKN